MRLDAAHERKDLPAALKAAGASLVSERGGD
jgi:hypothetical protein